jgi:hypothetical protein
MVANAVSKDATKAWKAVITQIGESRAMRVAKAFQAVPL